MKFLLLFGFWGLLSCVNHCFSQVEYSSLKVICTDSREPIGGELFILIMEYDTVAISTTDENREFHIYSLLSDTEYELVSKFSEDYIDFSPLKLKTESFPNEYILNLNLERRIHENSPPILLYEKGEVEIQDVNEIEFFAQLIRDNPKLCLEFSHVVGDEETRETLRERKEEILKMLEQHGANLSSIRFRDEPSILDPRINYRRSRIEGVGYSLDGNCGE